MICLVGDILTDVTIATSSTQCKMRLGGIVHAARGLWALGIDYSVAYFAPSYLDIHINEYLQKIGCSAIHKIGTVIDCPYTMLISEPKEIGNQGYEFLYHDSISIEYDWEEATQLAEYDVLMLISGNYNMELVLDHCHVSQSLYVDVANNYNSLNQLSRKHRFNTLFVSTSSDLFKSVFSNWESFSRQMNAYADRIVLKENRGGSRGYDGLTGETYQIPSQTSIVSNSVGVGDVYDVTAVALSDGDFESGLFYASWVAMHYAKTTFIDDFKQSVSGVLKIRKEKLKMMEGCSLPWEIRQNCNLYIAAPDFDFMNTKPIDQLCDSLTYHNFVPRRPIKENGQMSAHPSNNERQELYHGDMTLFGECNMLVAVLLNNDPGTLIEIGMSVERGLPTLVYDPYGIANNCMLTECPTLISSDLDAIIAKVFIEYSKLYKNGII